jgi:hypothetical protein
MRTWLWGTATLVSLLAIACKSLAAAPDAGVAIDAAPDAGPTRAYSIAATGATLDLTSGLTLTTTDLAGDVDAISVHQDFYGLPWDAFAQNTALPQSWVDTMQALAIAATATGKPVFLSITPLDGQRRTLADKVGPDGAKAGKWAADCYDFATASDGAAMQTAYTRYVTWMVQTFHPRWLNIAIEMNLFQACGAAWPGLVAVERAAFATAKAAQPDAIVFPSIQIDQLYGASDGTCPTPMTQAECFDAHYALLADVQRDRFAISSYPYALSGITRPQDLPADYLTRGADRGGEQLTIAETGWLGTPSVGDLNGQCITALDEDPQKQSDYFDLVIATATARKTELVTFFSNHDVIPADVMTSCPCTVDADWCGFIASFRQSYGGSDPTQQFYGEMLIKLFGTLGERDSNGLPRQPLFDHWQAARALPIR